MISSIMKARDRVKPLRNIEELMQVIQKDLYAATIKWCTFHPCQIALDLLAFKLWYFEKLSDKGKAVPALTGNSKGLSCVVQTNNDVFPVKQSLTQVTQWVGRAEYVVQTSLCSYNKY